MPSLLIEGESKDTWVSVIWSDNITSISAHCSNAEVIGVTNIINIRKIESADFFMPENDKLSAIDDRAF